MARGRVATRRGSKFRRSWPRCPPAAKAASPTAHVIHANAPLRQHNKSHEVLSPLFGARDSLAGSRLPRVGLLFQSMVSTATLPNRPLQCCSGLSQAARWATNDLIPRLSLSFATAFRHFRKGHLKACCTFLTFNLRAAPRREVENDECLPMRFKSSTNPLFASKKS